MRFYIALCFIVMTAIDARAAERVEIVLNEVQPRSVPWPITTGVPFPKGQLKRADNCRLVDDQDNESILQAKTTATWDGPTGSVRWLTIDFMAQPGRTYFLEYGDDVRRNFAPPFALFEKGDLDKVPGSMRRFLRDQEGKETEVKTANGELGIIVEETGPVRRCLLFEGQDGNMMFRTRIHIYSRSGLAKVVNETRFLHSTKDRRWKDIRLQFDVPFGPDWRVAVDADGEPGNQVVDIQPNDKTTSVSSYQSTFRHYGNPECHGAVTESRGKDESVHRKGDSVGEWMQIVDGKVAVTGSMQHFSKVFPVEWEATRDGLALHLWSHRGGELDFSETGIRKFFGPAGDKYLLDWKGVRAPQTPIENFFYFAGRDALAKGQADGKGINKHHEFYLHFGKAEDAKIGQEYGRLAARPPLALASGAWNAASDVMGPIAARPNDSPYEAIVDRLFDLSRMVQDQFGDHGWWLFGAGPHYSYQWDPTTKKYYADPRRFEYHTYQRETQQWWNYLRSGERKFFEWALPAENHWVDIAVSHQPTKFFTAYQGGEPKPATLHWAKGDWAIDSPLHFVRHHDTGEAWLRGQSQFWASYHRTLETTTLAYYLTGDERFQDAIAYWREYYGDLAGKTSDSTNFKPWHQEQAWFKPTAPGQKPKTWAAMIRDYAPFNSGSRHQQTLFFNLATLYEHTWDPRIRQALREYADAFLDPDHPIGVWRCQDNGEPIRADAPTMSHYWAPALVRYARATNDPRMPKILEKYFAACLGADPFHGDVGIYSNNQIGYAYAFSKDPRHLRAAVAELEFLKPNALPLLKPEDLNVRLYNPYAPIRSFAGVPRLVGALQDAKANGVAIPPPALTRPQRAPIAWKKTGDGPLSLTLWGFDREVEILGPDGKPFRDVQVDTKRHVSAIQPYDRVTPGYEVFEHRVIFGKSAPKGWYGLKPRLEMALLDLSGGEGAWCHAAEPVAVHSDAPWYWRVPEKAASVRIDTGEPKNLRIAFADGKPTAKITSTGWVLSFDAADAGKVLRFETSAKSPVWFRIGDASNAWVTSGATRSRDVVPESFGANAKPQAVEEDSVAGRFGKAIVIRPGRDLKLPEEKFDPKEGTLEFWVKVFWDERLTTQAKHPFVTNGIVPGVVPWKLPHQEWTHVAFVWRRLKKDPDRPVMHAYVNGLDPANYRSLYWPGYAGLPVGLSPKAKALEAWVAKAPAGGAYAIDELRVSSVARYAADVEFGRDQTVNPLRFEPARQPFTRDANTLLLEHFDE